MGHTRNRRPAARSRREKEKEEPIGPHIDTFTEAMIRKVIFLGPKNEWRQVIYPTERRRLDHLIWMILIPSPTPEEKKKAKMLAPVNRKSS